jgi:hypothetical protein
MGLEYKIIPSERKVLNKVTCDCCSKEIRKTGDAHWNPCGEPYSNFFEPSFDDFFLFEKCWGFDSSQDGVRQRAVICEDCYKVIFKDVKMEITHYFPGWTIQDTNK